MRRINQIRAVCHKNLLETQKAYTEYANVGRHEKIIYVSLGLYAKITKHQQNPRQKLDLPVSGPFRITGKTGNAWNLLELASGKSYLVHPDFIIQTTRNRNQLKRELEKSKTQPNSSPITPVPANPYLIRTPIDSNSITPPTVLNKNEGEKEITKEELNDLPTLKPPVRIQPPRTCKNATSCI